MSYYNSMTMTNSQLGLVSHLVSLVSVDLNTGGSLTVFVQVSRGTGKMSQF
jgi:hypothetical protein